MGGPLICYTSVAALKECLQYSPHARHLWTLSAASRSRLETLGTRTRSPRVPRQTRDRVGPTGNVTLAAAALTIRSQLWRWEPLCLSSRCSRLPPADRVDPADEWRSRAVRCGARLKHRYRCLWTSARPLPYSNSRFDPTARESHAETPVPSPVSSKSRGPEERRVHLQDLVLVWPNAFALQLSHRTTQAARATTSTSKSSNAPKAVQMATPTPQAEGSRLRTRWMLEELRAVRYICQKQLGSHLSAYVTLCTCAIIFANFNSRTINRLLFWNLVLTASAAGETRRRRSVSPSGTLDGEAVEKRSSRNCADRSRQCVLVLNSRLQQIADLHFACVNCH